MKTDPKEREIIQKALAAFQKKTGVTVTTEFEPDLYPDAPRGDAEVRLALNDLELKFVAEIKKTVTHATLGTIIQQLRKFPENRLLVTRYITPQIAERLKEMNIHFIDTVGNAYIYKPPLFVFIKGDKPIDDERKIKPTRAFQPTGMKVVFALLCNPGLEKAPYREIAKIATVALGTVNWVMEDLRQRGYMVDMGNSRRRLIQKENLLTRWVTNYPERLRPKQLIGTYMTENIDWWKTTELMDFEVCWGGEVAAAKLTKYLRPQMITIYAGGNTEKLMLTHRFKKNADGNIEVIKKFWDFNYLRQNPDKKYRNLVHPILIYADLLATGDRRNIETAEIIYEKEITGFVRED